MKNHEVEVCRSVWSMGVSTVAVCLSVLFPAWLSGFCVFFLLLRLLWLLGFCCCCVFMVFVAFGFFALWGCFGFLLLSLYACVCERNLHSFSARVLTCPFESSENRISGHLLKLFSNCIYILYCIWVVFHNGCMAVTILSQLVFHIALQDAYCAV